MSARGILGRFVLSLSVRSFRRDTIEPFEPDTFLRDGDTLDSYGVSAQIIALPGHTEGSIGVMVGGSDFFVGDALMNFFTPSPSLLYGHRADMLTTAAKISAFPSATVHFGHGGSVKNRSW